MVLVDEIDIWNKRKAKRQRNKQREKLLKQLCLTKDSDKKLAEAKMKIIYRDRLKRFLRLTARITDKRIIKIFSKHLREIETIFYERDEYKLERSEKELERSKSQRIPESNSKSEEDTPCFATKKQGITLNNKEYMISPRKSTPGRPSDSMDVSPINSVTFRNDTQDNNELNFTTKPLLTVSRVSEDNQDTTILHDLDNTYIDSNNNNNRNDRSCSNPPVSFMLNSRNNSFRTINESQFVDKMDMTVNFDLLNMSDTKSNYSQANNLVKNSLNQRFFGKSTKKKVDSKQVNDNCIYSQIRNIKFNPDDDMNEVIFISSEGTEFKRKDVYWVRRFQMAWRLRCFKKLTMKIVRERIRFKKEQELAEIRRKNRNKNNGKSVPPKSKKRPDKSPLPVFQN